MKTFIVCALMALVLWDAVIPHETHNRDDETCIDMRGCSRRGRV